MTALPSPSLAPETDLVSIRRVYARQLLARAGIAGDEALTKAFAAVAREAFLGPPPWELVPAYFIRHGLITDDPALLYFTTTARNGRSSRRTWFTSISAQAARRAPGSKICRRAGG
ncbi:hypothetical protein [Methylocystis heyeri]|uniref:Uncharacterized protein n=1 Tax=Methylocystis heyeri TaxID=391905 RepID=A0A6B8KIX3_9HYPH|nr:hypothetical protein [Methylocystis heyeri]QGM47622.1 hypothetical protein H2LOC_019145 [Methylocystis heyeri]